MAGGLPNLPPDAMGGMPGPGGPSGPGGPPPPIAALAAARPSPSSGGASGGGMSQQMLMFLAGLGFKDFVKSLTQLRGDKGKEKGSQASALQAKLGGMRSMPQNAMTPGGGPGLPPLLQGGPPPNLTAVLSALAAAANRGQS